MEATGVSKPPTGQMFNFPPMTNLLHKLCHLFQADDILLPGRIQLVAALVSLQPQPRLANGLNTADHIIGRHPQSGHVYRILCASTPLLSCANRFRGKYIQLSLCLSINIWCSNIIARAAAATMTTLSITKLCSAILWSNCFVAAHGHKSARSLVDVSE